MEPHNLETLPAEIRTMIFDRLFEDTPSYLATTHTSIPKQPGITRASRQLRHETLQLFYNVTTFQIYTSGCLCAVRWLAVIGPVNRGYIRNLRICCWLGTKYVINEMERLGVKILQDPEFDTNGVGMYALLTALG